ncbi:MAG: hypothetical protein ABI650_00205 [Dokdonella sp.]
MTTRNTRFMGPAGICPECMRACMGLHQVGSRCYHCEVGVFVHRGEWKYTSCVPCGGLGFLCDACHGTGVTAARIQDPGATLPP